LTNKNFFLTFFAFVNFLPKEVYMDIDAVYDSIQDTNLGELSDREEMKEEEELQEESSKIIFLAKRMLPPKEPATTLKPQMVLCASSPDDSYGKSECHGSLDFTIESNCKDRAETTFEWNGTYEDDHGNRFNGGAQAGIDTNGQPHAEARIGWEY
jgi:hypothetical protein